MSVKHRLRHLKKPSTASTAATDHYSQQTVNTSQKLPEKQMHRASIKGSLVAQRREINKSVNVEGKKNSMVTIKEDEDYFNTYNNMASEAGRPHACSIQV